MEWTRTEATARVDVACALTSQFDVTAKCSIDHHHNVYESLFIRKICGSVKKFWLSLVKARLRITRFIVLDVHFFKARSGAPEIPTAPFGTAFDDVCPVEEIGITGQKIKATSNVSIWKKPMTHSKFKTKLS